MKKEQLKLEINNLLTLLNKKNNRNTGLNENMYYILTTLYDYYIKNFNDGIARELLYEFQEVTQKLSIVVPEISNKNLHVNFPKTFKMISYLDKSIVK